MRVRPAIATALALLLTLSGLPLVEQRTAQAAEPAVAYTYDPLGRLKTVKNASGATATYNYDKVGNLLSITGSGTASTTARPAVKPVLTSARFTRVGVTTRVVLQGAHLSRRILENRVMVDGIAAKGSGRNYAAVGRAVALVMV